MADCTHAGENDALVSAGKAKEIADAIPDAKVMNKLIHEMNASRRGGGGVFRTGGVLERGVFGTKGHK